MGDGSKVKGTIMFRGREMQHPELGRRILDNVAEAVSHVGRVEVYPKQDGRNMLMVLVPGQATRKQREAAADRREADQASAGEEPTTEAEMAEEPTVEEQTPEDVAPEESTTEPTSA